MAARRADGDSPGRANRPAAPPRAPAIDVPDAPHGYVDRPRLHERLDAGTAAALTLVSAPAGTGKTTAVATWVTQRSAAGPTVWLRVDDEIPPGRHLWTRLTGRLVAAGVAVPRRRGLADEGDVTTGVLGHSAQVTLVLDCDRQLTADELAALDRTVRHCGNRLRTVLIARSDPVLPLHRYRLVGALREVRAADLALTREETGNVLGEAGVRLSSDALDAVVRRTQGWMAGVVLTAATLAGHSDAEGAARSLSGDQGPLAEYLLTEVLDSQTPAVRELMLRTSVLDLLSPGLIEAVAGPQAPRALSFLEHGNTFLHAVPGRSGCYRYHPLVAELLRAQLAFESPSTYVALHLEAAAWLQRHGHLHEAVRHRVAASDWEGAARCLVDGLAVAELLQEDDPVGLVAVVGDMPDVPGVATSLVHAALALADDDLRGAGAHLAAARVRLTPAVARMWPAADVALHVLDAVRSSAVGYPSATLTATAAADESLSRLEGTRVGRHPELLTALRTAEGHAHLANGDLVRAAGAFAAAASDHRPGREAGVIHALGHLALVSAWQGRLRSTVDLARQALALAPEDGPAPPHGAGCAQVALAWAAVERCDLAEAEAHLERAGDGEPGEVLRDALGAVVLARSRRSRHDLAGAHAVLRTQLDRDTAPDWVRDRLAVEDVAVDVVAGQADDAVDRTAFLDGTGLPEASVVADRVRVAAGLEPEHGPMVAVEEAPLAARVESWLVESWRCVRRGDDRRAVQALHRSLALAAPERLRRPFHEAPQEVRHLLSRAGGGAAHAWLTTRPGTAGTVGTPALRVVRPAGGSALLRRAGTTAPRPAKVAPARSPAAEPSGSSPVEQLTEKEQEVLVHLAELLTTEEIAATMFISVNTVRTHVRNILRKLSAGRRNEAIRRARELGILPGPVV